MNKHYYEIDFLKLFGSIVIVLYHYYSFVGVGGCDPSRVAFYEILHPVYNNGFLYTGMFFLLSGFVINLNYEEGIMDLS